jgi:hypothetical protein
MQVNEDLELNEINKTLLTIRDDESDYCCICINTENDIFVKLKCCNQSIHETCIIEFITSINNELYNCPICRKHLNTQVSFGKLIDYINENFELISKDKIQNIILNLYKDLPIKDLFNIDESAEMKHLKETVIKLSLKNDQFRMIIIILCLPVLFIICSIVFNRYK